MAHSHSHCHGSAGCASSGPPDGYPQLNFTPVGKKIQSIYENRLPIFTAEGEYKELNIPVFYDFARVVGALPDCSADPENGYVKLEVFSVPNLTRPSFSEALKAAEGHWRPAAVGDDFGPSWSTHWFRVCVQIPKSWSGKENSEPVVFEWDCGNEGLVYTTDGVPRQAFTGNGERPEFDNARTEWPLPAEWADGAEHLFYIETACNGMFGCAPPGTGDIQPPDPNRYFKLQRADLVVPNREARRLSVDFKIIADAARGLPDDSWQKHKARAVANDIMDAFDPQDIGSIDKCREIARSYLGSDIDGPQVFEESKLSPPQRLEVFGIGHCHIDTAWLWPFEETRRKVTRSWTTQMNLIEQYPEYKFAASQAQQYKWLKRDQPEVYARLRKWVAAGRFIPVGGSWVENDTNMPSGESLVRQMVLGQRFFESEFGFRCQTLWLPDTFGYSAQIPQLARLAGMPYFLTQKLSWNNINRFPHTTFNWVALDGSQVLCHMPPDDTYTALAELGDVKRSLRQHKNLAESALGMLVYGHGDGGGGPSAGMIENLRRCRGMSNTVGELPTVHLGNSVDDFFRRILDGSDGGSKLPVWCGELYFEFHRGTYTTQANTKRGNRESEFLLHELEYVATLASVAQAQGLVAQKSYKYPSADLQELWEKVCLCQFHDVLPGSSIELVYGDAEAEYAEVRKRAVALIDEAQRVLGVGGRIGVYPWRRAEIVALTEAQLRTAGNAVVQVCGSSDTSGLSYVAVETAGGPAAALPAVHSAARVEQQGDRFVLSNGALEAVIEGGLVTSLVDLRNGKREVVDTTVGKSAGLNQYVLFDDQPLNWQAWDTEVYSLGKWKLLPAAETEIYESGPLRASVVVKTPISASSWIRTVISLDAVATAADLSVAQLQFDAEVEWHEACKFLKVEFPVAVRHSSASYECQFGIAERPTHYNTSWDMAKFEVCSHKFADYSEYGFGVAVLNDSKYGFATCGSVMRLSLLRSPKAPDAHADMGRHRIRYAVLPHAGPLNPDVVQAAYNFNQRPLLPAAEAEAPSFKPLVELEGDANIVVSHVKRGEDDADVSLGELPVHHEKQTVVVRLYEALGGRAKGRLVFNYGRVAQVWRCNVLEDDLEELPYDGGVEVKLRGFEVQTLRFVLE